MEEIDPLLRELIAELNAASFETYCSCQGKTSEQDFKDKRHCGHAFVTFSVALIWKVAAKARKLGLYVSYRNRFITSLGGDEKDNGEIIAKNLNFPARMRELFGLPR
jgi:hypothetical protein